MPRTTPEFERQLQAHYVKQRREAKRKRVTVTYPTTAIKADAARAYERLPARRRLRVLCWLRDEIKEQSATARGHATTVSNLEEELAATKKGDDVAELRAQLEAAMAQHLDASEWAEENQAVLAVLQMIQPTRIPRSKR